MIRPHSGEGGGTHHAHTLSPLWGVPVHCHLRQLGSPNQSTLVPLPQHMLRPRNTFPVSLMGRGVEYAFRTELKTPLTKRGLCSMAYSLGVKVKASVKKDRGSLTHHLSLEPHCKGSLGQWSSNLSRAELPEAVFKMLIPRPCLHPGICFFSPPDPNSDSGVLKTTLSGNSDIVERAPDLGSWVLRLRFQT